MGGTGSPCPQRGACWGVRLCLAEGYQPALCPQGERATGFGVALLLALFGRASEDPLLNLVSPLGCEMDAQEGDVERDSKRRRLV